MGRIRYIKPGFFTNEDLSALPPLTRLLFAGIWTLADCNGRLEDRPKRIKAELFAYDTFDVDAALQSLHKAGFILRYAVKGVACIQVASFHAHQRPHPREPKSNLPEPPKTGVKTKSRGNSLSSNCTPDMAGTVGNFRPGIDLDLNGDGNGDLNGEGVDAPKALAPRPDDLRLLWNDGTTDPLPQCRELSDARKRHAAARLKDRPFAEWSAVISRIDRSDFCRGTNDRGWVATFDWMLKPDTAAKVLEGKYDNRAGLRAVARPEPKYDYDWRTECLELHGADDDGNPRCGNSNFHDAKMHQAAS